MVFTGKEVTVEPDITPENMVGGMVKTNVENSAADMAMARLRGWADQRDSTRCGRWEHRPFDWILTLIATGLTKTQIYVSLAPQAGKNVQNRYMTQSANAMQTST